MRENNFKLRNLSLLFGFLAIAIFIFIFAVLLILKPKMIAFENLSSFEEGLLTAVGFGLLTILFYFLLSLWQFIRYIRHADRIKPFPLLLLIIGMLSFIFLFSDVALLSDIHKQFRYGLSQPEWTLLLPILALQFIVTIVFLFIHVTDRLSITRADNAARDINIFLIVQYVGVISGLMGLSLACLGFLFPTGWNTATHSIMGGIVLLFPYALAIIYWLITKFQEKDRQWLDEKQSIDIGKSALTTLIINTVLMLTLFIINLGNLNGVIRQLWLPIYLFATIFIFSLGNLYFASRG